MCGIAGIIHKKAGKDVNVMTRQTAPNVYDLNASFYFYKRNFFEFTISQFIF